MNTNQMCQNVFTDGKSARAPVTDKHPTHTVRWENSQVVCVTPGQVGCEVECPIPERDDWYIL
jgi:hypothetical protein